MENMQQNLNELKARRTMLLAERDAVKALHNDAQLLQQAASKAELQAKEMRDRATDTMSAYEARSKALDVQHELHKNAKAEFLQALDATLDI